ncbi:MAG: DUF4250 domain-containing protein [Lachnospiraceae bacterium]|nr:DUF4250 domain-containing protein [Lachnospiraceae bacterium]
MELPKDPMILLSFVNTKLRDEYASLDEMCAATGADKEQIIAALSGIGYEYDEELNKFT